MVQLLLVSQDQKLLRTEETEWTGLGCDSDRALHFIIWRRVGRCCIFWASAEAFGMRGPFVQGSGQNSLSLRSGVLLPSVVQ